jgi:membrane protease YdiL (CAAX protease family)
VIWKKPWAPEAVLSFVGGVILAFFVGNIAAILLRQSGVHGFRTDDSVGTILLATLSFHGAVIVLGTKFLWSQGSGWREVFGETRWWWCLGLAGVALAASAPVIFGLKAVSEFLLRALGLGEAVEDQEAVKMILNAPAWRQAYLAFFAVVMAPLGEEFFFRGVLFQGVKRLRWRALGRSLRRQGHSRMAWFSRQQLWRVVAYIGVSFVFAAFHVNAPTFLPLFAFALVLTWLCERTGGLLAPMMAHSLFNLANLVVLLLAEKYNWPTS